MNYNIDKDIQPYLLELSERLWSGHASIMIGAGFSKNAKKEVSTGKNFPSWNELGDCFYKKLHNQTPTEKEKYLDVLKLASEIEATFKRPALDQILRKEIPDKEFQPSELHEKLLQLPWVDVFTTNYDTLLERTAEKILQQRYETVINKEDLVWSTKPRIIKLHGSFPSARPFIITEEDYRKYPKEFAPFVNTVQQSLLENTLCLIGFSGNDPNFLQWIGWIRDNLGKENSPKIFLIGILSLSVGEKKLLEKRNIVPIDLSSFSNDHYETLLEFVEYLHQQGKVEDRLNWASKNKSYHFDINKDIMFQFEEITKGWREIRLDYPNWLILPENSREMLQMCTMNSNSFIYHIQKTNSPLDIEFLYELNWRLDKCLIPIFNDWINFYENIIEKYNPFPQILQIENAITPETHSNFDWNIISNCWIEIQLSMLRFYREEGFNEKWTLLTERIDNIKNHLSPELYARYYYERCLYYLFLLDVISVKRELNTWERDKSLPYWEAKKAGLMAELGDVVDAEKILELSLKEIRSRLNLSPMISDYSLISQEAYILQLLKYVKNSLNLSQGKFVSDNKEFKEYSERWNRLTQYKCDPWGELKSFETFLQSDFSDFKPIKQIYGFNIGRSTTTHKLERVNPYMMKSYAYLRYVEETGIPFKLSNMTFGKEAANKAISCIANHSSAWAFVSFIRTGDTKTIDTIWGRKALSMMKQQNVDTISTSYLSVLETSAPEIRKGSIYKNNNFAISLSTVIPEILSRLCVKCSYKVKIKIFIFLKELYLSDAETQSKYKGVKNLVPNLIKSFSWMEQYNLLPLLLEFPIIFDSNNNRDEYPDPISFIRIDKTIEYKKISINSEKINELISFLSDSNSKRELAIIRLVLLWQCGLLTQSQENKFGQELWKQINGQGFPAKANYYYFAFLSLPHPKEINPQELLRNYIKDTPFPIQKEEDRSVSVTGGDIALFHNILGTVNKDIEYEWNSNELNGLILNIIKWWDADKKYLKQTEYHFFGSTADEFKARFRNMIEIFSNIISLNIELFDKANLAKVEVLLDELKEYNMPEMEAKVSFLKLFPTRKEEIYNDIYKKLCSKNEADIFDAINAISVLLEQGFIDINNLIECIAQNIRCRTEIKLNNFLNAMIIILKNNIQFITDKILDDLSIGLSYLVEETEIYEKDTDKEIHEKLLIKISISRLIILLKRFYLESKRLDLPHYVTEWENLCLDVNEFSEIRNIWINGK